MATNRFPKQGTYAWYVDWMDGVAVARIQITKKWIDKEAYSKPTQVATVRVREIYGNSQHYDINSKIIIDETEQLCFNEREVLRRLL